MQDSCKLHVRLPATISIAISVSSKRKAGDALNTDLAKEAAKRLKTQPLAIKEWQAHGSSISAEELADRTAQQLSDAQAVAEAEAVAEVPPDFDMDTVMGAIKQLQDEARASKQIQKRLQDEASEVSEDLVQFAKDKVRHVAGLVMARLRRGQQSVDHLTKLEDEVLHGLRSRTRANILRAVLRRTHHGTTAGVFLRHFDGTWAVRCGEKCLLSQAWLCLHGASWLARKSCLCCEILQVLSDCQDTLKDCNGAAR